MKVIPETHYFVYIRFCYSYVFAIDVFFKSYFFNILGAFLIPYFICVFIGGMPIFYLECTVGQFMGVAGLNAWKICPLFQGKI